MARVWEPATCCGCGSPRTGTMILGYWYLISAVSSLLGSIIKLVYMDDNSASVGQMAEVLGVPREDYYRFAKQSLTSLIVGAILVGSASVMLLIGVEKRKLSLMIPYMILQVLQLIGCGIFFVVLLGVALFAGYFLSSFLILIIGTCVTFLFTYFFLVVRVHYMEIKPQSSDVTADTTVMQVGFKHELLKNEV